MDKLLFTPGPLTTSMSVKEKMLNDYGSRDTAFIKVIEFVRNCILKIAGLNKTDGWETIIIQGSGTFGIESVISSVIPNNGKLLIISNGAYGKRMAKIAKIYKINYEELIFAENSVPDINSVESYLSENSDFSHLAIVHCETTTGILNPIEDFGRLAKKFSLEYIVDAMSSFGAIPIDFYNCNISFLISSSNKCIEGVPGFSFVIAHRESLIMCENNARTLCLDLYDQWNEIEKTGQFRFTPPVHVIMAFSQALIELEEEGGVAGRAKRYSENHRVLIEGMRDIGFTEYIDPKNQSYIITSFIFPDIPGFEFKEMYTHLNQRNFVIYPGKLSKVNTFRIGSIGRITQEDVSNLIKEISSYLYILLNE